MKLKSAEDVHLISQLIISNRRISLVSRGVVWMGAFFCTEACIYRTTTYVLTTYKPYPHFSQETCLHLDAGCIIQGADELCFLQWQHPLRQFEASAVFRASLRHPGQSSSPASSALFGRPLAIFSMMGSLCWVLCACACYSGFDL